MNPQVRRRLVALVAVVALGPALFIIRALPAVAAVGGAATIVAPGATDPLGSGISATAFSLSLPRNAACSGDSAEQGFRVQSYMVPASVDPAGLQFGSTGPRPTATGVAFRQPLYTTTTSGYVNAQTANADEPGDPGAVVNIPAFSLAVFTPNDIPPGKYNVGIACTKGPAGPNQVERFWNAEMVIAASATDLPAGVTWTNPEVVASAAASAPGSTFPSPVGTRSAVRSAATSGARSSDAERATGEASRVEAPAKASGAPPTLSLPELPLPSRIDVAAADRLVLMAWLLAVAFVARLVVLSTRKPLFETSR